MNNNCDSGVEINTEEDCSSNCEKELSPQTSKHKWSVMSIIMFGVSIVVLIFSAVFAIWNFTIDDLGFLVIWLLSFVAVVPASIVSLVLSIVAVCIRAKRNKRGKGFAIASLTMSSLSVCLSLIIFAYPFILNHIAS